MSTQFDTLQRTIKSYNLLALSVWDQLAADPASLRSLLAVEHDNRTVKADPVLFEDVYIFPEAHRLGDTAETAGDMDRWEWAVPISGYQTSIPFQKKLVGRPQMATSVEKIVRALPAALELLQVRLMMNVFRKNVVGRDGKNFFAADHPFPADKGTYDNTLSTGFATPGTPTIQEVKDLYYAALMQFAEMKAIQVEVIDLTAFAGKLTIFVHNQKHHEIFLKVATIDSFGVDKNELKGAFRVFRDFKPTAGDENKVEAVLDLGPGGPKPAVLVIDTDPEQRVSNRNEDDGYYHVIMEQQVGVRSAHPFAAIQAS